jgi:hypothetical protein
MEREFDAILLGWQTSPDWEASTNRLSGAIYGDKKGRFADGQTIHTSPIVRFERTVAGTVAVSRSGTRYLLA